MDHLILRAPIAISCVTEAELLHGLARKPDASTLRAATYDLFSVVKKLPWDSVAASGYASLRLQMSEQGKALSSNDMLIAAHALAAGAILVTRDTAFSHLAPRFSIVNWATDL
jgi:tRNA(fMet)-specific endonuclease VapC